MRRARRWVRRCIILGDYAVREPSSARDLRRVREGGHVLSARCVRRSTSARRVGSDSRSGARWPDQLNASGTRTAIGRLREATRRAGARARDQGAEYGRDHAQVAITLGNLGNAYGDLGDHAKTRDMLERALAIKERAYGRDHPEVAITLTNLGNAYGSLGDHAKKRDVLERALAIDERAYGRDHPQVAITLGNLGTAYGDLGDHAKKRDMLARALAIEERRTAATSGR